MILYAYDDKNKLTRSIQTKENDVNELEDGPSVVDWEDRKIKKVTCIKNNEIEENCIYDKEKVYSIHSQEFPKGKIINTYKKDKKCKIRTSSDEWEGEYSLMSLDEIIPSHDPLKDFKKIIGAYDCQERRYEIEEQLQNAVIKRAKDLQPRFLVSEALSPEDGPPVVDKNTKVVLGGNSRIMMLILCYHQYKSNWIKYQNFLLDRIHNFGITIDEYYNIQNPVLVRTIEANMAKCADYSVKLNTSTKQEENLRTKARTYAKQILPYLYRLGEYLRVGEDDLFQSNTLTFNEVVKSSKYKNEIINIFETAGIITKNNKSLFVNSATGKISEYGALIIKLTMLSVFVPSIDLIEDNPTLTENISSNIYLFIQILSFQLDNKIIDKSWDITPFIKEAFIIESSAEWIEGTNSLGSLRIDIMPGDDKYVTTKCQKVLSIYDRFCFTDLFDMQERIKPNAIGILLWHILSQGVGVTRKVMKEYIKTAINYNNNNNKDIEFNKNFITPIQTLKNLIDANIADQVFNTSTYNKQKLYKKEIKSQNPESLQYQAYKNNKLDILKMFKDCIDFDYMNVEHLKNGNTLIHGYAGENIEYTKEGMKYRQYWELDGTIKRYEIGVDRLNTKEPCYIQFHIQNTENNKKYNPYFSSPFIEIYHTKTSGPLNLTCLIKNKKGMIIDKKYIHREHDIITLKEIENIINDLTKQTNKETLNDIYQSLNDIYYKHVKKNTFIYNLKNDPIYKFFYKIFNNYGHKRDKKNYTRFI